MKKKELSKNFDNEGSGPQKDMTNKESLKL